MNPNKKIEILSFSYISIIVILFELGLINENFYSSKFFFIAFTCLSIAFATLHLMQYFILNKRGETNE